jgi:hypothetical protein
MRRTVIAATDDASGPSVDRVDCLVRADVDIGHIRRLTVDGADSRDNSCPAVL